MISTLFSILLTAIVLYVIYLLACRSMSGQPLKNVGIALRVVFGVVCLFIALRFFNVISI